MITRSLIIQRCYYMFNVVELMEFIVMILNPPKMSNKKILYLKPLQARSSNARSVL